MGFKDIKTISHESGISDVTLRKLIKQDKVRYSFIYGKYLIDEDSLLSLVEQNIGMKSTKGLGRKTA